VPYEELLPGTLGPEATAPRPVFRPHNDVKRARHRALLRQAIDATALAVVNVIVYHWDSARLPFVSRDASVDALLLLDAAFVAYWVIVHKLPAWRARRIAASWRPEERRRVLPSTR
jgi:hypothetical protein